MRVRALAGSLAFLVFAAVGCGGDGEDTAVAPDSASLVGEWTNTCERGTVKVFALRSDGTYTFQGGVRSLSEQVSNGTYSVAGDTVTFGEDDACRGPGTYRWERDDGRLAFMLDDDGCWGRSAALGGYVFTSITPTPAALQRGEELAAVGLDYEAAWEAHDPDALGALLADDGFVFSEPGRELTSKQRFLEFMTPYVESTAIGGTEPRIFVGSHAVVEAYEAWGFGGATETAPVVEVDLLTLQGDRIGAIQALYGTGFLAATGLEDATSLLRTYEAAWSATDPFAVEDLYAETAVRSEPLFGVELRGRTEIGRYAAGFHLRHPGSARSIVEPYLFGDGDDVSGAVFRLIADGCEAQHVVLLETDDDGSITRERIYYDPGAIMECGWRR
jgi:ketosteroid isomerase-like protein